MSEVLIRFGTHLPAVIFHYLLVCAIFAVLMLSAQGIYFYIRRKCGYRDKEKFRRLKDIIGG